MGLTDDQKAMLRLLAQREEGYEDMAKLMGISVEELRRRVDETLAEVGEEAAAEPAPAPVEPAPPAPPEPAPPEPAPTPPPRPAKPRQPRPRPQLKLPDLSGSRGALVGIGAGALVLIAFAIVLIVAGDGGGSQTSSGAAGGNGTQVSAEERNLTQAVLAPSGAQPDASGRALFGRYKKKVLLQVEAAGLEPSPQGKSYTVWLYSSPKIALQVGAVQVGEDGKIAAQFQIPAQLLEYVASGAFNQVDVSLTSIATYKAAFNKAKRENKVPRYVGESILRGPITGPAIQSRSSAE